ncbi:hypothetical protein GCM10010912_18900 [Paenibacillus albidus]|uniref:Uncharacterized protein n=1 Tax=Paenibacillus albidus TaxID=2041023 RepID=A0A917C625_9BACL|nr:hypothetical protein GCM10010912_18900 [Paenibacillus albidus]
MIGSVKSHIRFPLHAVELTESEDLQEENLLTIFGFCVKITLVIKSVEA